MSIEAGVSDNAPKPSGCLHAVNRVFDIDGSANIPLMMTGVMRVVVYDIEDCLLAPLGMDQDDPLLQGQFNGLDPVVDGMLE